MEGIMLQMVTKDPAIRQLQILIEMWEEWLICWESFVYWLFKIEQKNLTWIGKLETVKLIMTKDLNFERVCAKMVATSLSGKQNLRWNEVCLLRYIGRIVGNTWPSREICFSETVSQAFCLQVLEQLQEGICHKRPLLGWTSGLFNHLKPKLI